MAQSWPKGGELYIFQRFFVQRLFGYRELSVFRARAARSGFSIFSHNWVIRASDSACKSGC